MQKLVSLLISLLLALFSFFTPSAPDYPPHDPSEGTETETGAETETEPETESVTETETDTTEETESETASESESEKPTDDLTASPEYASLLEAGFPASYALPLAVLLREHPDWEFVPLDVTGLCDKYTWDYVLDAEMFTTKNNLIPNQEIYAACFHPTDTEIYDYGYRAVSREALAHYMDPRNFLNEIDIFQFFDVSATADMDTVQAVLRGTFMEGLLSDGSETYASLFVRAGERYGVSAAYLAVRGRLEHGMNGSPTALGTCGTAISKYSGKDETALDGYYNFFNIGATGNGAEQILRNAVKYAMEGKNGIVWDTLEKSVMGGASVIADRFITNHQDTPYLLKFNVDVRSVTASGTSRNFWGQHAQNVMTAYAEGRTLARAFEAAGCTDGAYRFLIPVYAGMPDTACENPGA